MAALHSNACTAGRQLSVLAAAAELLPASGSAGRALNSHGEDSFPAPVSSRRSNAGWGQLHRELTPLKEGHFMSHHKQNTS